jgi:DNA-binding CsgD family transcriptional regulator/tetratricopeptide (TPR) repeat protein
VIDLLDSYATELSILTRDSEVVDIQNQIVEITRDIGDEGRMAKALADAARAHWSAGNGKAVQPLIAEAIETVADVSQGWAAANVYATAGVLAMLARDGERAVERCTRAVALARKGRFDAPLVRALNGLGSARIGIYGDIGSIAELEQSAAIASTHGWDWDQCGALSNLGSGLGEVRHYERALHYLQASIDYATERDLDGRRHYSTAWLARVQFEMGHWQTAAETARSLPDHPGVSPIVTIVASTVLGRIRTRRGDPGADEAPQRAWELAVATNDLQRLWPAVAGRAERAWLTGVDRTPVGAALLDVLETARSLEVAWAIGELSFWADKLELGPPHSDNAAEPFLLHLAARHDAAADAWATIGCPYEQAFALADSGRETGLRTALDILNRLGASPLAERVRQQLCSLDAGNIPTGPRRDTLQHPAGLTPRQAEVLELLCDGLTDRQIADALFISPKTAGHHVSAVLRKMGVDNRAKAASQAIARGWVAPQSGEPESAT